MKNTNAPPDNAPGPSAFGARKRRRRFKLPPRSDPFETESALRSDEIRDQLYARDIEAEVEARELLGKMFAAAQLDERARDIVIGHLAQGYTREELAARWGISVARVTTIEAEALAELRRAAARLGRMPIRKVNLDVLRKAGILP